MPAARPRVLLVGAYERDNFGDLLFLLQTEQYLPAEAEVVAGAPFGTDMTTLLDRRIVGYGPLLETGTFDHIWTVGGEVGGADLRHAFRMCASDEQLERWRSGEAAKAELIREHNGNIPIDSPYLPRPSAYPKNLATPTTINSVGFTGVSRLPAHRQQVLLDISRSADRISVRDETSSEWLTSKGIAHTVAPDLVHTIARTRPRQGPRDESLALVQLSQPEIKRRGVEAFAEAIARSEQLARYRIRFFLAGTAPGHDSVEVYEELIKQVRRIAPKLQMEISDRRRPYDLVDEIASAGLWVGLSLHGRIISGAYGVPRVSFTKRKVDAYAATWDPAMPYAVTPDRLDDAISEALSPSVQTAANVGDDLAAEAERNILDAVSGLASGDAPARVRRRLESLESWRRWLAEQHTADRARIERLSKAAQSASATPAPPAAEPAPTAPKPVPYLQEVKRVARRGAAGALRRVRKFRRPR